jgi:hypothetical protein
MLRWRHAHVSVQDRQTRSGRPRKNGNCGTETEAIAYARQLLMDWRDCAAIEVLQAGELIDRLRPTRKHG